MTGQDAADQLRDEIARHRRFLERSFPPEDFASVLMDQQIERRVGSVGMDLRAMLEPSIDDEWTLGGGS